jgi:Pterin 4 alpha carbinolamine dehydratase
MAQPLSEAERAELLPALDGWSMVEGRDAITKRFTFKDFNDPCAGEGDPDLADTETWRGPLDPLPGASRRGG